MTSRYDSIFRGADHLNKILNLDNAAVRFDDMSTAAFLRQLEEIETTTYEVKYGDIKYSQYFPIKDFSNGAASWTYRYYDKTGSALVVDDYGDDFPTSEVKGYEENRPFRAIVSGYQYNFQDLRAQAFMGGPKLDEMKAVAARAAIERLCDQIAATGDSVHGLYGLCTAPGVAAADTAATSWVQLVQADQTNGTTLAPGKILADIQRERKAMKVLSRGTYEPDTLLLPLATYALLDTTPRSPTYTNDTLRQYIAGQCPGLNIDWWQQLDNAGAAGVGRAVFFKKDPSVLRWIRSQETEILAPVQQNLAWRFPMHKRIGGVQVLQPLAVRYLDGTQSSTGT